MRNKNNKHLGIEVDPELHYKLRYIAKYEGRSANGQILYLIRSIAIPSSIGFASVQD